jgi:hypothetical protein
MSWQDRSAKAQSGQYTTKKEPCLDTIIIGPNPLAGLPMLPTILAAIRVPVGAGEYYGRHGSTCHYVVFSLTVSKALRS